MKNTMKIITDEKLAKYTHAASESMAEELATAISKAKKAGYTVTYGESSHCRVPNSYGYTTNMHAPYYVYDGREGVIKMVDGDLSTVSGGYPSRCIITVEGSISTDAVQGLGLRCCKRTDEYTKFYTV